jgi:hypothetical protein
VAPVFGALPSAASVNTLEAPTGGQDLKLGGVEGPQDKLGTNGVDNGKQAEGPEITPKKHRQRVELNVFKVNPIDQNKKDGADAAQVGDGGDSTTTAKHWLGIGKTPVKDLVNASRAASRATTTTPSPKSLRPQVRGGQ